MHCIQVDCVADRTVLLLYPLCSCLRAGIENSTTQTGRCISSSMHRVVLAFSLAFHQWSWVDTDKFLSAILFWYARVSAWLEVLRHSGVAVQCVTPECVLFFYVLDNSWFSHVHHICLVCPFVYY
eukprot:scpid111383/ scgid26526/ 